MIRLLLVHKPAVYSWDVDYTFNPSSLANLDKEDDEGEEAALQQQAEVLAGGMRVHPSADQAHSMQVHDRCPRAAGMDCQATDAVPGLRQGQGVGLVQQQAPKITSGAHGQVEDEARPQEQQHQERQPRQSGRRHQQQGECCSGQGERAGEASHQQHSGEGQGCEGRCPPQGHGEQNGFFEMLAEQGPSGVEHEQRAGEKRGLSGLPVGQHSRQGGPGSWEGRKKEKKKRKKEQQQQQQQHEKRHQQQQQQQQQPHPLLSAARTAAGGDRAGGCLDAGGGRARGHLWFLCHMLIAPSLFHQAGSPQPQQTSLCAKPPGWLLL